MKYLYSFKNSFLFLSFIVFFTLSSQTLFSQTDLLENTGAARTNYIFINDNNELPVSSQIIVKRGYHNKDLRYVLDEGEAFGYAYGYGLETYHMEFISEKKLADPVLENKKKIKHKYYQIKLADKKDKIIAHLKISYDHVNLVSNNEDMYTYSINLEKIPIILLYKTKKIYIDLIGYVK